MSIVKSIGVCIILTQLHSSLCLDEEEGYNILKSQVLIDSTPVFEGPQCDCEDSQKKVITYEFTCNECPSVVYSPNCEEKNLGIDPRRKLDNRNSNINVNSNSIQARRSIDDNENSNVNINTNDDNADADAAILLHNLGLVIPRPGSRRHHNLKSRYYGSHSATSRHGQRNRNVFIGTHGRNVGGFGDSDVNDDNIVYVIDDDATESQEKNPEIVVAGRRYPHHHHHRY